MKKSIPDLSRKHVFCSRRDGCRDGLQNAYLIVGSHGSTAFNNQSSDKYHHVIKKDFSPSKILLFICKPKKFNSGISL
jgi:hypothetical protein